MFDKQVVLDVSLDGRALERHAFDKEQVGIGGHPRADVVLEGPSVSPLHARILNCESRFLLEDCGSSGGTFVNGVKRRTSWLEPGDEIRIGKYCLSVDICAAMERCGSCSARSGRRSRSRSFVGVI
jgi:pSer/pThr/pTyr-binding forkhead associated (FHA) protein